MNGYIDNNLVVNQLTTFTEGNITIFFINQKNGNSIKLVNST